MTALLYGVPVTEHAAGYTRSDGLVTAWKAGRAVRVWRLGSRIVSLQLRKEEGRGLWKQSDRLATDDPGGLLDALERIGVRHPSSYADCYHQLAPTLRPLRHTYNGIFSFWSGGAWSQARMTGSFPGTWYRYDLVSAYRWAATLCLPDPATYAVTKRRGTLPGLWRVQLQGNLSHLPPVFQTTNTVVMSSEEIEQYKVRVRVERGVTWTRTFADSYVERTLQRLPCAKEAGRAFWGKWIARDPLIVWTPAKEWQLRNIAANFVWGWLIVGRVRARLWEVSEHAAHLYVDEVLVPHQLPTGSALGSWALKEEYRNGIDVVHTGWFGAHGQAAAMHTGMMSHVEYRRAELRRMRQLKQEVA